MTRIRQALLPVLLVGVLALVGCGSTGQVPKFGKPNGTFTVADLNGTYVFSLSGSNTFGFFAAAGTFHADGAGKVTNAVFDFNSSGNGVFPNVPASGNYTVAADGRGTLTLNSQVTQIDLAFVLASSQRGLVIRFDTNATASGTLDLQDPNALSATAIHGPYVFNLGGVDSTGGILVTAGVVSADGSGNLTNGVLDQNDNGVVSSNATVTGVYTVGTNGRGTMQLVSSLGNIWNFAVYVVNANHLKLVQTDTTALAGDVFSQTGAVSNANVSGGYAFTSGGMSANGPFVTGGVFTADGNGNITAGARDENDSGAVTANSAVTGQYALAANGRGTLALTGSAGTVNFAIYPSNGGLQMIQLDSTMVTNGTAFSQVGTMLSTPGVVNTFAYNMTGAFNGGGMDSVAQFTADGKGGISGIIDYNLSGSLSLALALNASYSVDANGRGLLSLRNTTTNQNFALYVANGHLLLIDLDRSIVGFATAEPQLSVHVAGASQR